MRWPLRCISLIILASMAGCVSGRVIEQPIAIAGAAARFHSVNGIWPQSREDLLALTDERARLVVSLRRNDKVWLHDNEDGSATITWMETAWWGGNATAIRIVPPRQSSTLRPAESMQPPEPEDPVLHDYAIEFVKMPRAHGRRLN